MLAADPPAGSFVMRLRSLAAGVSLLLALAALILHLAVMTCFAGRWDKTAAITIIPIWAWSMIGLTLAAAAWIWARGRLATIASALWLVTLFVCPDEWRGLWRSALRQTPAPQRSRSITSATGHWRVVTLNCRASNLLSAREASAWNPDVLLLQEMRAYRATQLRALARELWGDEGGVVYGHDTAILARGRLTPNARAPAGHGQQFIQATLTRPDGRQLEIASVHLQGHVTDLDLWNWRTWRAHAQNQRRHRLYMADVMLRSLAVAGDRPCLIGGDFNSPAGDRTFQTLRPHFQDAFAEAGLGWGNTFRNDWPVLRIDQVWATPHLRPQAALTVRSDHSDHRLVIVDYHWP
ncbi:MAG: endonuclease/exonuclease/phosphatase family protein [Verrucomicrobiales bacterium]